MKRVLRRMVESAGYRVSHCDVLQFGIKYMLNVARWAGLGTFRLGRFSM